MSPVPPRATYASWMKPSIRRAERKSRAIFRMAGFRTVRWKPSLLSRSPNAASTPGGRNGTGWNGGGEASSA